MFRSCFSIFCLILFSIYKVNFTYASSGKIELQDSNSPVVNLSKPNVKKSIPQDLIKAQKRNIIDSDGWVRIGVLLPLSGKSSTVGNSLKKAAEIALFSSGNSRIILQFYDTNNFLLTIKDITKQAISERVDVIIGPLFGKEVYDVVRIANSYDIPVISFSNDEKSLNYAGVYSINYLLSQEIDQIIGFTFSKGRKVVSAIIPEDINSDIIESAIKKATYKYSGNIQKLVKYKKGDQSSIAEAVKEVSNYKNRNNIADKIKSNVKKQMVDLHCDSDLNIIDNPNDDNYIYCNNLKKLDKSLSSVKAVGQVNFDTIFVYGDSNDLVSIGSYLLYYDINNSAVKIIGTSAFDNRKIFTEHGYYGAWFTGKNNLYSKSFDNEYTSIFNENPSKLAMLAYDAISVIASSTKNGVFDIEQLNNPGGFFGISGLFKFMRDNTVMRTFEIKEIIPRTSTVILPSAKSFSEMNTTMQNNINKSKNFSNIESKQRVDLDWILDNLNTLTIDKINSFLIE